MNKQHSLTPVKVGWRRSPVRRGAAAVEFALVAPLLFLFLMGLIELGRVVMVQNALSHAAREAGRLAVIDGSTPQQVRAVAERAAASASVPIVEVEIDPPNFNSSNQLWVTIQVSTQFDQVSWLPGNQFFRGIQIRGTSTVRRENYNLN